HEHRTLLLGRDALARAYVELEVLAEKLFQFEPRLMTRQARPCEATVQPRELRRKHERRHDRTPFDVRALQDLFQAAVAMPEHAQPIGACRVEHKVERRRI